MDLTEDNPQTKEFIPEDKDANLVEVHRVNRDQFGIIYKRNVGRFILHLSLSTNTLLG